MSTGTWKDLETVTGSTVGPPETAELGIPCFTMLVHPDPRRIGERSLLGELQVGREVQLSRLKPIFASTENNHRRALADPHISRLPLRLVPGANGGIRLRDDHRKTRVVADGESVDRARDFSTAEIERGVVLSLASRIVLLLHYQNPTSPTGVPHFGLVGESTAMLAIREQIARVARSNVPALLRGETGTGKELVARAIHQASSRRTGPFVAVNMGAVPPALAASELFGVAKGAFTGADRKRVGYFTRAEGGTLFLDEVGETPAEVQAVLLRVLETNQFEPVGSEMSKTVNVRVLAATDAHLESEIESGRFRRPLLHRLSGYEIALPTLRDRREDLGRLLIHFLHEELEALGETWRLETPSATSTPWLTAAVVSRLAASSWPGNVRQLRNISRQLVIDSQGSNQLRITPRLEALLEPPEEAEATSHPTPTEIDRLPASVAGPTPKSRRILGALLLTELVQVHGLEDDRSHDLRSRHDPTARGLLTHFDGYEIDNSERFLALFERPADAVSYALAYHRELETLSQELGIELTARVGLHFGDVLVRRNTSDEVARGARLLEVEGRARPILAQLISLASGRQTLLTRSAFDLAQEAATADERLAAARWLNHGSHRLDGKGPATEVFEVTEASEPEIVAEETPDAPKAYRSPGDVNEDELLRVLRRFSFRLQPAAAALGISRTSLYALIDKSSKVRKAGDLKREEIERVAEGCASDLEAMAAALEVSRKGLRRRMTQLGLL